MKKLLLKNWRDVLDRKAQFLAIILLVALGVSSYVALISAQKDLTVSYNFAKTKLKLADFSVSVVGAPKSVAKELEKIKGVRAVQPRLIIDTGFQVSEKSQATARVIGISSKRRPKVNDVLLVKGKYFNGVASAGLIDSYYAEEANRKVGQSLTLLVNGEKKKIKIKGVVSSPEYLFAIRSKEEIPTPKEFVVVFMDQLQVEKLFGMPPSYNDFSLLIDKGANRAQVIKRAEDKLKKYRVITTVKQEDQPSNFRMKEEIRQNEETSSFIPTLILVISSISIFIALSRLVASQRGMIGLSKALGYSNSKIVIHYLVFSLFIAIVGAAIGFGLGQYFARSITELYSSYLRVPFLKHKIYPDQIAISGLLSLIACVFGGFFPAWASARMLPAEAMRSDPSLTVKKAKTPIIERILSKLLSFPFIIKIPLRNVFRVKKRSIYTIIGIAFALILTVVTLSSFDAFDYLIKTQFNKVDKWDLQAGFEKEFSDDQIKKAADLDGVKKAQASLIIPAKISANKVTHQGTITAMKPSANFHGFRIVKGDSAKTALEENGLIMTPRIAKKLKVKVGDKVKVKSPFNDKTYSIKLLALSDELLGGPFFTSLKTGKKLMSSPANIYNVMYLRVEKDRISEVKKDIFNMPAAANVIDKAKLISYIEKALESSLVVFAVMLAFGFAIAFVITYNTFTTNILERTREIATMRTIGEDRFHMALAITYENLILAAVGIPLGIYLGYLSANAMYESFSNEAFSLSAVIYPMTYVYVITSIIIVLLLSEIPPIRRVFRLDLAEATKAIE
ncbi:MAG: ABC transporter permease [Actinobacteria bacterium]|nr:MAG: ABC transporter permease [Actinomycetota bacterium]